jgi:hypothetical protein
MVPQSEHFTWVAATTAYHFNLSFYDFQQCVAFRNMLIENGITNLRASYENLTGSIPPIVCELIETHQTSRRVDLANIISFIRYNHMALKKRPVHMVQITTLAAELADPDSLPLDKRRSTFLQTLKHLVDDGMDERVAAATSFHLHNSKNFKPSTSTPRYVEIQPHDTLTHHTLPNTYLGVDSDGKLQVIDTGRGVYTIETTSKIPCGWLCRADPESNTFVAGNEQECVGLVLNGDKDACDLFPINLPINPSGPNVHSVENTWVAWGSKQKPHAFQWGPKRGVHHCSKQEARNHIMAVTDMVGKGNTILMDNETLCALPPDQSISCMYGNLRDVDVITRANDLWRIDILNNHAWCVGIPDMQHVKVIAPLVDWR